MEYVSVIDENQHNAPPSHYFQLNVIMTKQATAHLCMFLACVFWGLMSPIGKEAMTHGIGGIDMVFFRVCGAAALFWTASLFMPRERVSRRDMLLFPLAAIFGLVCNQCGFIVGLSLTSPVNASIVTTSLPIFSMITAAIFMHEPITAKKVGGVVIGCIGAVVLVLTSAAASSGKAGDIRGDLLCLIAQLSFALFLALFSPLVRRHSVFTVNKWMFTWAIVYTAPLCLPRMARIEWAAVPAATWWETAYVVVVGTFVCYILSMVAQHTLRPTVISAYNYMQPIVAIAISVAIGIGTFSPTHALAAALVFAGVWMINKSKAKESAG